MKNRDLMLDLHYASKKYIYDRIETDKDKKTFLITHANIHHFLRYSEDYYDFHKRIMDYSNRLEAERAKKWTRAFINLKYEWLAIDNCCDIVNSLDKRFGT